MYGEFENPAEAQEKRVPRTRRRAPRDEQEATVFRLALTRSRVARHH
jgi:hypothetical protein